jgi:hypothetical protein
MYKDSFYKIVYYFNNFLVKFSAGDVNVVWVITGPIFGEYAGWGVRHQLYAHRLELILKV